MNTKRMEAIKELIKEWGNEELPKCFKTEGFEEELDIVLENNK